MKGSARLLLAAILLSTGAYATKVPIPVEGASLNISVQVQPQFLINEASSTPRSRNINAPWKSILVWPMRILNWRRLF